MGQTPRLPLTRDPPFRNFRQRTAGRSHVHKGLAQGLHFLSLGLHFLSFWPFGPSFPFIWAFWAFISFHFGLVGLHFLSFWPCGPSFPFIWAFWAFISFSCVFKKPLAQICHPSLSKMVTSSKQIQPKNCLQNGHFGLLSLLFLSFWPFRPSFPFILAFWTFISFHFGLLGLHFVSFWPCGPSFPFILTFWAFISLHFGLLGLHLLSFWFFGPSFPFILAFWAFISIIFAFQKGHLARIWPKIAISPLNFAIFPFSKFAF